MRIFSRDSLAAEFVEVLNDGREVMQVMLNIPDVIPQEIVNRILKQVESQLQPSDDLMWRLFRQRVCGNGFVSPVEKTGFITCINTTKLFQSIE